jgi:membrane-associated phospholipid phosphatase
MAGFPTSLFHKSPSPLLCWVGGSALVAGLLSIPLLHGDLSATVWNMALARNKPWLLWWSDVAGRSIFQGKSFGAQDLSYVLITIVAGLYVVTACSPRLRREWIVLRLWAGYYLGCMLCFLVVNRGMKAFFGRGRPVDVLRGDVDYSSLWLLGPYSLPDALSKGSFTSGHTTTAMFLLPMAFLVLGSSYRAYAWVVFFLALLWGLILGWGRVLSGSHYPGDVLWAMTMCLWICAFYYYHLFAMHCPEAIPSNPPLWELRLLLWFPSGLLGLFIALIGLKQTIFNFFWYWPLVAILGGIGFWMCWRHVERLRQSCSVQEGRGYFS